MKKAYIEERLEEILDLRWNLMNSDDESINTQAESVYYNAVCATITRMFGDWTRDDSGKHKVHLEPIK